MAAAQYAQPVFWIFHGLKASHALYADPAAWCGDTVYRFHWHGNGDGLEVRNGFVTVLINCHSVGVRGAQEHVFAGTSGR